MTNRENVLRALRRDHPERVPFDFILCPSKIEEFKKMTGRDNYMEYYHFPFRFVELNPTVFKPDYTVYYKDLPANAKPLSWNPEWGVLSVPGSIAHFEQMLHPMQGFTRTDEIDSYPFPDFTKDYRWTGVKGQVEALAQKDLISVAALQMTLYEMAWYLRGLDELLVDMLTDEEFSIKLLDKLLEIRLEVAKKYAQSGVDIIMLGDDVSTQIDMVMSRELWCKMLKPRMAEIIRAAKKIKPDLLVFYHGDGNLMKIIPDLIEIGVDILNPVQPECMNPVEIKRLYGRDLSFWGTLGTQTVLPFGTPEDVKLTCKTMIEEVGRGGGLLLAPTHVIEPEVPWENIHAFIEAVGEYGRY